MKKIKFNNKGMTLVELLLTFALMAIALTMIYTFMLATQKFYANTTLRADQQSQLRVIMLGLKEELATAADGSVLLIDAPLTSLDSVYTSAYPDWRAYYFDGTKMIKRDSAGNETTAFIDFKLDGFDAVFSRVQDVSVPAGDVSKNLIRVSLKAGDNVTLEADLALLNTGAGAYDASDNKFIGVVLAPAQ